MKHINIDLHVGIGLLELGMNPEQMKAAVLQQCKELVPTGNHRLAISEDREINGIQYRRYFCNHLFFLIAFKGDSAVEIGFNKLIKDTAVISLYGMDAFATPAEQLILALKEFSSCRYDSDDELLSTEYEFDEIGIRLWRQDAFHPKLLLDEDYMNMMYRVIDDMREFLYFDIVAVRSKD